MSLKIQRNANQIKEKEMKLFTSRNIQYIKKPKIDKNILHSNIKSTKKLDNFFHPAEWLHLFILDLPPKGSVQVFFKKYWYQYTNMRAELDCVEDVN